jgi:hypothetical protein
LEYRLSKIRRHGEERSDEAIHGRPEMDCFASLAKTGGIAMNDITPA